MDTDDIIERLVERHDKMKPLRIECDEMINRDGKEAADEIGKLRTTILYALDCLNHDDVNGAIRTLRGWR